MEMLFENKFNFSTKINFEFRYRTLAKTKNHVYILMFLLFYFAVMFNITKDSFTNSLFSNNLYNTYILLFIGMALRILITYLPYCAYLYSLIKNKGIKYEKLPTIVRFTDKIELIKSDSITTFDYFQITKVLFLKNIIALMISKNKAIVISNKGFTVGDLVGFKIFIHQKILPSFVEKDNVDSRKIKNTQILALVILILYPLLTYIVLVLIPSQIM